MALEDTYTHSAIVAKGEADELSEMELAVLLLGDPSGYEQLDETARAKAQKMLDLSVAEREGVKCAYTRCHTPAVYEIEGESGKRLACQKDLAYLINGPCTITLLQGGE